MGGAACGSPGFRSGHFLPIDFTKAYFEAASGLTTTGGHGALGPRIPSPARSTCGVICSAGWGGMGIIVLAVAILPMLGVGGMQILSRAEMPGPMKDSKLTPASDRPAKLLWAVYAGLTLVCIGCLRFAGMNWFDGRVSRILGARLSAGSRLTTPASGTSIRLAHRDGADGISDLGSP